MISQCLSCDWDFNENPNDRGSGNIGGYFCKWCSGEDELHFPKEKALEKLSTFLKDHSEVDAQKATAGLNSLYVT